MTSAAENKAIVRRFFAHGFGADESKALVTEDFRWVGPASLEFLFDRGNGQAGEGPDSLSLLPMIEGAIYKRAEPDAGTTNVHFMIAEGDVVVIEFDATRTTFDDQTYRNQYCLVFLMRGGKIAEVHEHVDSHYSWDLCFSTPEARSGVLARLGGTERAIPLMP